MSAKSKSPSGFELTAKVANAIKAQIELKHPLFSTDPQHGTSPHNIGMYGCSIEALYELGANKRHSLAVFTDMLKEVASRDHTRKPVFDDKGHKTDKTTTLWQRFKNKEVPERADEENAKDLDGKIIQNLQVLQRVKDYGRKLLQYGKKVMGTSGCVIEMTKGSGDEIMVSLNTDSAEPVNEFRRVRADKPKSKAKAKVKAKASKSSKSKAANGGGHGGSTPKVKTPKASKPKTQKATPATEPETVQTEAVEATEPATATA